MSAKMTGEDSGPNSQPFGLDSMQQIEQRINKQADPIQLGTGPGGFILVFLIFALLLVAIALQLRWHVSVIPADVQRDVRNVDDNLTKLRNELQQRTNDRFHAEEFRAYMESLHELNPDLKLPSRDDD